MMTLTSLRKWETSGIPLPQFEPAGSANVVDLPLDRVAARHAERKYQKPAMCPTCEWQVPELAAAALAASIRKPST